MSSEPLSVSRFARTAAVGLALAFPPTRLATVLWLAWRAGRQGEPAGGAELPPEPAVPPPGPAPDPVPRRRERSADRLLDVEGIGEVYARKLAAAGVGTVDLLLQKGGSAEGRRGIAEATGISERLILRWVQQVDLFRIRGVGEEYAELLVAAGVTSVPELARQHAAILLATLREVNQRKKLVRQLPRLASLETWIAQAQALPGAMNS